MNKLTAGAVCEFIGAFALMLVGGGAILHAFSVVDGVDGQRLAGLIGIALAHGLILAVTVTAAMHISGGQFNPAVSIALSAIGKQPWPRTLVFIIAQCAGGIVAALILKNIHTPEVVAAGKLGATLGRLDNVGQVFLLEVIATFLLMFTILGSAVDQRGVGKGPYVGGFAIGLCVAANILFFGPLSGASMNPARSLGPAVIGGYMDMHWVYWAAPITGALMAAFTWKMMMVAKD